ncbi:hypothetical protein PISL3812_00350 [Talaromyces islandicus]|uniref:Uncharacterized protein n=1 Tax=Talaromyces islandicus TaxID=28573 RepID=A0A0U1LJQ1_TALIS|nr:hypothetical protein PISL3812_00350 [Talaromyces islandicus]
MADTMNIENIDSTAATTIAMASKFSMKTRQGTAVRTAYMGTVQYKLEEFIYEEYNPSLHDITGIFHGQRVDVNSNEEVECTVKVRMQLNSALAGHKYGHFTCLERRSPENNINEESRVLRACAFSGRTPKFLDSASEVQDHTGFFPGGYLHVLATSRLPGQPISRLLGSLTEDDLKVIKQDLVTTINYMRNVGYVLHSEATAVSPNATNLQQQHLNKPLLKIDDKHVWYDRSSQTVYFFDLSRFRDRPYRPYPFPSYHYNYNNYYDDNFAGNYYPMPAPLPPRTEEALMRSQFWKKLVASQVARIANATAAEVVEQSRVFQLCLRNRAATAAALKNNDDWQMVDAVAN